MVGRRILSLAAVLVPVSLAAAQDRNRPADDRAGSQPAAAGKSLDGTWTVVSCSKDGRPTEGADRMTVTIRDNLVTFNAGAGGEPTKGMNPVRIEFLSSGLLRATEVPGQGQDRSGGAGTADRSGAAGQSGTAGQGGGKAMSGVYVLTPDYFAVSILTPQAAGERPGTDRSGPITAGDNQNPGQSGTAGQGRSGSQTMGQPQMQTHMSVVLKRAGRE